MQNMLINTSNNLSNINQATSQVIKGEVSEILNNFGRTRSVVSGNLQKLRLSTMQQPINIPIERFYNRLKNKFVDFNQITPQLIIGQLSELSNDFDITKSIVTENLQKLRLGIVQQPINDPIEKFDAKLKEITKFINIQLSISQMTIINELNIEPSDEAKYLTALKESKELSIKDPVANKSDIAKNQIKLGIVYYQQGRFKEAKQRCFVALKVYEELVAHSPEIYFPDLADTKVNLGAIYRNLNNFNESEKSFIDALSIYRQLIEKNPDIYLPRITITQNNLGVLYTDLERLEKAEKSFLKALKINRKLADQNPGKYRLYVAQTQETLGILYYNQERFEKSLNKFKDALETYNELANKKPEIYLSRFIDTMHNLGVINVELGRTNIAKRLFYKALLVYKQLAKKAPDIYLHKVAITQVNLGNLNAILGKYDDAELLYEEACEIFYQIDNFSQAAEVLRNIGQIFRSKGDLDKAIYYFHEALSIYNKMGSISGRAEILCEMGSTYKEADHMIEALNVDLEALEACRLLGKKNDELEDEINEIKKKVPDVYFSVYSPVSILTGKKYMLKVSAYILEKKSKMHQMVCSNGEYKEKNSIGPISAKIGDPLDIYIDLPSPLVLLDKKMTIPCSKIAIASFGITVPETLDINTYFGEVKVKVERSEKLRFRFILDIERTETPVMV